MLLFEVIHHVCYIFVMYSLTLLYPHMHTHIYRIVPGKRSADYFGFTTQEFSMAGDYMEDLKKPTELSKKGACAGMS